MKRYVIERDIPGLGKLSREQLKAVSLRSMNASAKLGATKIHWEHSYITGDKSFCIYLADSVETIYEHGRLAEVPVTKVTESPCVLDPTAAYS